LASGLFLCASMMSRSSWRRWRLRLRFNELRVHCLPGSQALQTFVEAQYSNCFLTVLYLRFFKICPAGHVNWSCSVS
jgi:hypothetical protein